MARKKRGKKKTLKAGRKKIRKKIEPKRRGRKKQPKIRKRFRLNVKKPYLRKYLRNVSPENSLWIINGDIVKSLRELLKELKIMNDEAFRYHVNKERSDFSRWIKEIIGDKKLASDLKKAKTRDKAIKAINNRIKDK